jgi:hypothetical protein
LQQRETVKGSTKNEITMERIFLVWKDHEYMAMKVIDGM